MKNKGLFAASWNQPRLGAYSQYRAVCSISVMPPPRLSYAVQQNFAMCHKRTLMAPLLVTFCAKAPYVGRPASRQASCKGSANAAGSARAAQNLAELNDGCNARTRDAA